MDDIAAAAKANLKSTHSNVRYRRDIDGLRALSVTFVVVYHAFPNLLRGGFVGVDIFFVISGFLITLIILSDLEAGTFSFATFYARRVRRIFPALLIVLAVSLAVGWFTLLSDELLKLGKHAAAGAAFFVNFIYIKEAGYFDVDASRKMLLHLWSLSVEEQYYVIWPALAWLTYRRRWLGPVTLAIIALSFLYNIRTVETYAPLAFFSPLSRTWELLAGALLAYRQFGRVAAPAGEAGRLRGIALADLASLAGLAILAVAVLTISAASKFPGWYALEPVIGAVLLLGAGPQAVVNRLLLSRGVLVWIGLISYPLYLWHWPLLVMAGHIIGDLSLAVRLAIVAASVAAAWLTYVLLERPIRFGLVSRRRATAGLVAAMLCVGLSGYAIYIWAPSGLRSIDRQAKGYAAYFARLNDHVDVPDEQKAVFNYQCSFYNIEAAWHGAATTLPLPSIDPACYAKPTAKAVMLWGDSFAAHLYSGLKATLPKDVSLMLVWSAGCKIERVVPAQVATDHCQKMTDFGLSVIAREHPDVVVLSSSHLYDIGYVREIVPLMKRAGVKKVIVLGPSPVWNDYLYKIILRHYLNYTPRYIPGYLQQDTFDAAAAFRRATKPDDGFDYVDLRPFFCTADGCLAYLGDDRESGLVTLDYGHLRPFASTYLARNLLTPLIMKQFPGDDGTAPSSKP